MTATVHMFRGHDSGEENSEPLYFCKVGLQVLFRSISVFHFSVRPPCTGYERHWATTNVVFSPETKRRQRIMFRNAVESYAMATTTTIVQASSDQLTAGYRPSLASQHHSDQTPNAPLRNSATATVTNSGPSSPNLLFRFAQTH